MVTRVGTGQCGPLPVLGAGHLPGPQVAPELLLIQPAAYIRDKGLSLQDPKNELKKWSFSMFFKKCLLSLLHSPDY